MSRATELIAKLKSTNESHDDLHKVLQDNGFKQTKSDGINSEYQHPDGKTVTINAQSGKWVASDGGAGNHPQELIQHLKKDTTLKQKTADDHYMSGTAGPSETVVVPSAKSN